MSRTSRVVERAGKTQTLIVCPSASPLFTVLPVFLIVASTVSYVTVGSVVTSAV